MMITSLETHSKESCYKDKLSKIIYFKYASISKLSKSKLVKLNFEGKHDFKVLHESVRKIWEREQQHIKHL